MLYHAEVFMPANVKALLPKGVIELVYSRHAEQAAISDRYGSANLPEYVHISAGYTFEVEVEGGKLVKFATRLKYDNTRDMVVVVSPSKGVYIVRTVWFNLTTDKHRTLDRTKYVTRGEAEVEFDGGW